MLRKLLAAACFALCVASSPAKAVDTATAAATCGSQSYTAGYSYGMVQDLTGLLCVSASVSASVTGFAPATFGSLTATASSSASTALPAGANVALQNTSTVDVSCVLDPTNAVATTNKIVVRAGSTVFVTVGSNTKVACINQTGSASNVVAMMGGSGLGTNFGGGGSGGGGAVTLASGAVASGAYSSGSIASGAVASGAYASGAFASGAAASGSWVDGAIVTLGTEADAAWVSGNGTVIALLKNMAAGIAGSIPAGTNLIGNVGSATGSAPPSAAVYLGANASGATGGKLAGLINCDSHVFKHITSATDTLAVQGVASQTIYICAWRARAAGVATWFLENTASANANCSSANTQITGVATEAANTGEVYAPGFWNGLKNTSGNGLCINSTGTGGVDIDIWFTQF